MASYYDELLQLCGFEVEEMEEERPRIEQAFHKLGIGPQDMEPAMSWVRQNHDVTLMGVRKLLGAWLKELIDMVLAKEEGKKIVYYGFPTVARPGMLIAASARDAYIACPDTILCHTMGQIFNKLTPILEAGEENGLPPGHALQLFLRHGIQGLGPFGGGIRDSNILYRLHYGFSVGRISRALAGAGGILRGPVQSTL